MQAKHSNLSGGITGNPLLALQNLLPQFEKILEAGEAMESLGTQLSPLLDEVTEVRQLAVTLMTNQIDIEREQTCQRWVSLRLLQASMSWETSLTVAEIMLVEEQFRDEFYGMMALTSGIEALKEAREK